MLGCMYEQVYPRLSPHSVDVLGLIRGPWNFKDQALG